jgi:hypothetical protein
VNSQENLLQTTLGNNVKFEEINQSPTDLNPLWIDLEHSMGGQGGKEGQGGQTVVHVLQRVFEIMEPFLDNMIDVKLRLALLEILNFSLVLSDNGLP